MFGRTLSLLLRYWRLGVLAGLLFGVGWTLSQVLPVEPRWQLQLDLTGDNSSKVILQVWWDQKGKWIRVLTTRIMPDIQTSGPIQIDLASGGIEYQHSRTNDFYPFTCSSDGRFGSGTSRSDRAIHIIDFEEKKEKVHLLPIREVDYSFLVFSPDGQRYMVESRHQDAYSAWVYQVGSDQPESEFSEIRHASFLPYSSHLAYYCDKDPPGIRLWDLKDKRDIAELPDTTGTFEISPDGKFLASAGPDANAGATLWNISEPSRPRRIGSTALRGEGFFSPDSSIWAYAGMAGGQEKVEFWDTREAKKRFDLADVHVDVRELANVLLVDASVYFSPNSKLVCVAAPRKDRIRVHELESGNCVSTILTSPIRQARMAVEISFTSDSRRLMTIDEKRTFHVWSAETGDSLFELQNTIDWRYVDKFAMVRHDPDRDANGNAKLDWFKKILDNIMPKPAQEVTQLLSVLDLEKLGIITTVENRLKSSMSELSPDGRSLLVAGLDADDNVQLVCWDVPTSRPWRSIVGIPIGLGAAMMLLMFARSYLRRRAAPHLSPT